MADTGSTETVSLDDIPINRFHVKITALTFGAHFTDGYSLGGISIVLGSTAFQQTLSPVWQGLLGSSALIGLFFGSLITGWISDRIGRQKIFLFSFVLISLASLLQFFANDPMTLLILRLLIGFGIGGDYSVGVTLLAEFVPTKGRGVLLGCLGAVWTVGYVAVNIIGFYLTGPDSWRWLLASACIPALIVLLLRIGTPESPRWLIRMGRKEEAQAIIDRFIGPNVKIEENVVENLGFRTLFTPRYRKMTAFCTLFCTIDVFPYFAVYTFLPSILAGFGLSESFFADMMLNIALLVGSVLGLILMSKLTRRQFSIGGYAVCAVGLGIMAMAPGSWTVLVLIAFAFFTIAISAEGNLVTVFPTECMPTEIRATGMGFATAFSRIGSAMGTFLLPLMLSGIGPQWTMGVLALVCLGGTLMCQAWAPATEHLSLAQASGGEDA